VSDTKENCTRNRGRQSERMCEQDGIRECGQLADIECEGSVWKKIAASSEFNVKYD